MANNNTSLDQLKGFLNKLFQFDSQDLDFGVYKILHYKKKEIANFIDQLLVDKVKEQLQTLSEDDAKNIKEQIADLEKDDIIKGWLEAEAEEKKTLEKFSKDKINQYKELKAKATDATVSVETENQIYNHLTLFFSRYYDKGDFISKRRFGKNEKYMVPYNGEETHFHWANHDQYYIKSSETFNHYAFKVQTADGNLIVNFKLHDAQLEQGNVKAEETNFFMLADKSPEVKEKDDSDLNFVLANKQPDINDKEITIYFEYRPLADKEKTKVKGNSKQDTLDEIAFEFLKKKFGTNPLFANLWKEQEGKPLLLKKLQHYTRKNKHDFFIHKNLKGFLERELDYYIKSELVNVDDLYVTDSDTHFDRLKHNLKTIKVFKTIADTIVDFVSQIEDFQKKLWEKKKFVLSTEWVITIDRLVEYIGEEAAKPILEEVIKNEKQVAEWKELFGEKNVPAKLSIDTLKVELLNWRILPIDTKHFTIDFKPRLLTALSHKIDFDRVSDGLVINSDNYHGLNLLITNLYSDRIRCIYNDPPYNKGKDFAYKDSFRSSSWCSLIENRLELLVQNLPENAIQFTSIDNNEFENIKRLNGTYFQKKNVAILPAITNLKGNQDTEGFVSTHEYLICTAITTLQDVGRLDVDDEAVLDDWEEDDYGLFKKADGLRATGTNAPRIKRPNLWYPIFINEETQGFYTTENNKPLDNKHIELWPINEDGQELSWYWKKSKVNDENYNLILTNSRTGGYSIYKKQRPKLGELPTKKPKSVFYGPEYSSTNGGNLAKNIFGYRMSEFTPKSVDLIKDLLTLCQNELILDYFAGSGTTFHASQLLTKQDSLKRKVILMEQGSYVPTVIIPRIKKIAYTFDWKDGKPKDDSMNGLGVFFKYQRLEQYEEALENIAFNASEDAMQKALEFEQYIPKYFLEFETKGSQTLVNTAAMQDPWDYKLKVWDGFTYDTEQAVDLVETFNYLIGLHMQKCITKEISGKKYQFIIGHNNANKQIAVVWRSVVDWKIDDYKADATALKEELKAFTYDLLYINDQAHIEGYQPIEEVFKNKMLS